MIIAPQFVGTKYKSSTFTIKIRTHIISDFRGNKFKNNLHDPKHTINVPSFCVDKNGTALASSSTKIPDPNLIVDNAAQKVMSIIIALSESSYDAHPRDVVTVNLVLESKNKTHVTRVGMCSCPNDVPLFSNHNAFSRA